MKMIKIPKRLSRVISKFQEFYIPGTRYIQCLVSLPTQTSVDSGPMSRVLPSNNALVLESWVSPKAWVLGPAYFRESQVSGSGSHLKTGHRVLGSWCCLNSQISDLVPPCLYFLILSSKKRLLYLQ